MFGLIVAIVAAVVVAATALVAALSSAGEDADDNFPGDPVGGTTASCHVSCPPDFIINAPCRIIKADGGRVRLSASELVGYSGGNYAWTTASTKIRLNDPNSSTVSVEALANPSVGRDAETITVTRDAPGCPSLVKTVNVTVAKVTFSASPNQRYGYDNYDTPANSSDDHVCVKSSDYTFVKVDIGGGAIGTDFNFVCDSSDIAPDPPPASASFDLRVNANLSTSRMDTVLYAKCTCSDATPFANLAVHVYKERAVDVVVAKIDNPTTSYLRFPTADYGSYTNTANGKLKEAVVKYNITNFDSANATTPITYVGGAGVLSYDIANGGGTDLNAIRAAMTGTGTKVRVAIIRDMKSYYYLSAAVAAGATTLTLTAAANAVFYHPGDTAALGAGATQETVSITAVAGNTITCNALANAHAAGEAMEFPAAGWGSDPILIMEGNASLDFAKDTILHEVGHRDHGMNLLDVIDAQNIMHFQQGNNHDRLRYCPRLKNYPAGTAETENQWETIPRD